MFGAHGMGFVAAVFRISGTKTSYNRDILKVPTLIAMKLDILFVGRPLVLAQKCSIVFGCLCSCFATLGFWDEPTVYEKRLLETGKI